MNSGRQRSSIQVLVKSIRFDYRFAVGDEVLESCMSEPQLSSVETPSLASRLIFGKNPKVTLVRALLLILVCYLVFNHVLIPIRVTGVSMEPTYRNGRINFVNRFAFRSEPPKRGDVVGIMPEEFKVMYMKRVIALPTERVRISEGIVYINGDPIQEPYTRPNVTWNRRETQLGPDEYFVIGDNRTMSIVDHAHGKVWLTNIVGKVLF